MAHSAPCSDAMPWRNHDGVHVTIKATAFISVEIVSSYTIVERLSPHAWLSRGEYRLLQEHSKQTLIQPIKHAGQRRRQDNFGGGVVNRNYQFCRSELRAGMPSLRQERAISISQILIMHMSTSEKGPGLLNVSYCLCPCNFRLSLVYRQIYDGQATLKNKTLNPD